MDLETEAGALAWKARLDARLEHDSIEEIIRGLQQVVDTKPQFKQSAIYYGMLKVIVAKLYLKLLKEQ